MKAREIVKLLCKLCVWVIAIVSLIFSVCELLPVKGEIWNGITIGKADSKTVIEMLGEPEGIDQSFFDTFYYYKTGEYFVSAPHRILLRFGIVQQIDENFLLYLDDFRLVDLISRLGSPDLIAWSLNDPGQRTIIFFRKGVIADVVALNFEDAYVTKITYFKPCSCWSVGIRVLDSLSLKDPFPESDVVGPKDPWFGTSKACRGYCQDN